jgi:DNA invertase Pin-like site-specific DNA recombinase
VDTSLEGLLLEAVKAYVAASERRSIRQRTSAGIKAHIAAGRTWGGSKIDPSAKRGRRRLDDDQERAIAARAAGGESVTRIAASIGQPRTTVGAIVRRRIVDNSK